MSSDEQLIFSLRHDLEKAQQELALMKSLYEEQVGINAGMRATLSNIAQYTEKLGVTLKKG